MEQLTLVLLVAATIGSGLMAGLFCSFSNFIMRALARLKDGEGIAAMQSINLVIVRPAFLLVFQGTGLVSLGAVAAGWLILGSVALTLSALGSAVYLVGCLVVTIACNVPLNNRLAAVDPHSKQGSVMWQHYLDRWVWWNHVRSLSTLASTLLLVLAVYSAGTGA